MLATSALMQPAAVAATLGGARRPRGAAASPGCSRATLVLAPRCRPRRGALRVAAAKDEGNSGDKGFKTSPLTPAFTRRREHTMGRVAALGFAFSLVGELLGGVGPISQLHFETGVSYKWLYLGALGLAAWGLIGGALSGPTWDPRNRQDIAQRKPVNPFQEGAANRVLNAALQPRKFIGRNEVLVGRLAMAGFAGACVLEYLWGGEGPLVHLGLVQSGTQLMLAPWWIIGLVALFVANGLGLFSAIGRGDDEAY